VRGVLKRNEPLAPYTSWHIGGPADLYYRPRDLEDLVEFLGTLPSDIPLIWLGLGSNVLVSDAGIRGVVIHLLTSVDNALSSTALPIQMIPKEVFQSTGDIVRAEAGVTAAKLAKFCIKHGLTGAEFFAGIPGTVGGALAMNAGAWGGETWRQVVKVEVINRRGERSFRDPEDYHIGYRSVVGLKAAEEWFVAGYFQFQAGDSEGSNQKIKALLKQRNERQPIGVFSCGSVFKNPDNHYAGQLIEELNLKGYAIGDAEISSKHANFIVNRGQARANDVWQLIRHIQTLVLAKHQIELHTEVKFLGEFP